jgi:hypothetical protein
MPADQWEEVSMKMDSGTTFWRRRLVLAVVDLSAHVGKSSATAGGIPLTDAQSVRSYFTFGLASLILEDRAAATGQGESPVLDRDPFIGRAKWDISDLSIDVTDTGAPKTVGTVTFINLGEKIVLELLRSGKEWRIADVEWGSGSLRGLYRRKAAYDGEAIP